MNKQKAKDNILAKDMNSNIEIRKGCIRISIRCRLINILIAMQILRDI